MLIVIVYSVRKISELGYIDGKYGIYVRKIFEFAGYINGDDIQCKKDDIGVSLC